MKRAFNFKWYAKKDPDIVRNNRVIVSNTANDIGVAAKHATELFTHGFGSLVKNEIIEIQELDDNYKPIGEPITPSGEATVPVGKK